MTKLSRSSSPAAVCVVGPSATRWGEGGVQGQRDSGGALRNDGQTGASLGVLEIREVGCGEGVERGRQPRSPCCLALQLQKSEHPYPAGPLGVLQECAQQGGQARPIGGRGSGDRLVQPDDALHARPQQGVPGGEVVLGGAQRHIGRGVDGPVCQTPAAGLGQDVDGRIAQEIPSFLIHISKTTPSVVPQVR